MFGLPTGSWQRKHGPGFRGLIGYFARRAGSGGYQSPEKTWRNAGRGEYHVNISYLLGLDWTVPADLEIVRDREKQLKQLRTASKEGAFDHLVGTVSELRPKLVIAEQKVGQLKEEIERFEVADAYRELSDEAAAARSEMLKLELRAVILKDNITHLTDALHSEVPKPALDVSRLYEAVGIQLPGVARRRFDDVTAFHASVIANRKAYLEAEIEHASSKLRVGIEHLQALDKRRSVILSGFRQQKVTSGTHRL